MSAEALEPKKLPFLRTQFNYKTDLVSDETGIAFEGPGLCQQHFKEECDINTIVERFGLTGQLPEVVRVPVSGDFTGLSDYKTALDAVRAADSSFMELPAELRARFRNDPQELMLFMEDGSNYDEAVKLGLVNPKPQAPQAPSEPVQATPPKG